MVDNVSLQVHDAIVDSLATEIVGVVVMVALCVPVVGVSVVRNQQEVRRRVFRMVPRVVVSQPVNCVVGWDNVANVSVLS